MYFVLITLFWLTSLSVSTAPEHELDEDYHFRGADFVSVRKDEHQVDEEVINLVHSDEDDAVVNQYCSKCMTATKTMSEQGVDYSGKIVWRRRNFECYDQLSSILSSVAFYYTSNNFNTVHLNLTIDLPHKY